MTPALSGRKVVDYLNAAVPPMVAVSIRSSFIRQRLEEGDEANAVAGRVSLSDDAIESGGALGDQMDALCIEMATEFMAEMKETMALN